MGKTVYLIGTGMGGQDSLTVEAQQTIDRCTLLIGAQRLLEPYDGKKYAALVPPDEIAACISKAEDLEIAVLLSGDTGFYSGAARLLKRLEDCEDCAVHTIAGISSLSWFCARIGLPWQDVKIISAHGRQHNAVGEIQRSRRTFLLTDKKESPAEICRQLARRNLAHVTVWIGERLGYPDERIVKATALDASEMSFDGLAVMLAENPKPVIREYAAPFLADGDFIRGDTPMTKEAVRVLALSKLRIKPDHVVWDVGAGSGSVSVELAFAAAAGQVFAVEQDGEALDLIRRNREKFGVTNLAVMAGKAPEALQTLPAPDRVFLGGTGRQMAPILSCIMGKNPGARVAAAAVTLETLQDALRLFPQCGLSEPEIVQVSIANTRKAGQYHMMQANNPVWLITGEGRG